MDTRETNETGENLRVLVGTCEFHLSYFKKMLLKGSRIPKTPILIDCLKRHQIHARLKASNAFIL